MRSFKNQQSQKALISQLIKIFQIMKRKSQQILKSTSFAKCTEEIIKF